MSVLVLQPQGAVVRKIWLKPHRFGTGPAAMTETMAGTRNLEKA
jgi:hypothetical protein